MCLCSQLKNNGPVLLDYFQALKLFLLSDAMNGKDGQGLKLKNVGPNF